MKPVIFAALFAFVLVESISCFSLTPSAIPSNYLTLAYGERRGRNVESVLAVKCSMVRMTRRVLLNIPMGLPLLASAVEPAKSSTSETSKKGESKPEKPSAEVNTETDIAKKPADSNSLAMKECDTPAKQETKKQEICEVDY